MESLLNATPGEVPTMNTKSKQVENHNNKPNTSTNNANKAGEEITTKAKRNRVPVSCTLCRKRKSKVGTCSFTTLSRS